MTPSDNRFFRIIIPLLTVGVWGLLLHSFMPTQPVQAQRSVAVAPKEVGRYQMVFANGAVFVLDTKTGTIRGWTTKSVEATWDKKYSELEAVTNK